MPKSQYIYSDPTISTSAKNDTPYGIYDNDKAFISESVKDRFLDAFNKGAIDSFNSFIFLLIIDSTKVLP